MARTKAQAKAQTGAQAPAQVTPQTDRTLRTGDDLPALVAQVIPGTGIEQAFSTGSLGYRYNGKAMTQDGVRYQATVQLVRINTKPA